jgi:hypothetical protein
MVEGVDHYLSHSHSPELEAWFRDLLAGITRETANAHNEGAGVSNQIGLGMAIALDHLKDAKASNPQQGDANPLDLGMLSVQELMDSNTWLRPLPEVKSVATTYRGLIRFLAHAQNAGCLAQLDFQRWRS